VMTLAVGSQAEARPLRGPVMRAERRAARALAVPERPGRQARAETPADRAAAPRQPVPKAAVPRAAAPRQVAAEPGVPASQFGAQASQAAPAKAKAKADLQPTRSQSGVQQATYESVGPKAGGGATEPGGAAEPGEDGTFSVLVRPEAAAQPAGLEPLTFPNAPAAKPAP